MTSTVDRCLLVGMHGYTLPGRLRDWLADGLGGVVLFAGNIADRDQLGELVADIRSAGEDVVVAVDEEGGDVTRLHAATGAPHPGNLALGAVDDVALTERVGAAIGAELAALGINLNLAPVADVNTNPDNPIIGTRSFGADPDRVAAHVVGYLTGLQSTGVAACAKHFPGHGDTAVDSHLALPTVTGDLEPHLVPFRAAIAAGVRSVLTAHVTYPGLCDGPATLSRAVLTGLLRDELGFTGAVVTDSMTMSAIAGGVGVAEGAARALAAGADLVCMTGDFGLQREVRDHLVGHPALTGARIAQAAARVRALARPVPGDPTTAATTAEMADAARGALVADPGVGRLDAAPYVLELSPPRQGIEPTAGSLLAMLTARDPRVTGARLAPDTVPGSPAGRTAGRPDHSGGRPDHTVGRTADPAAGDTGMTADIADRALSDALAAAAGKPLVVVVRDAHRVPATRQRLGTVLANRPDAVVVGIGTGADRPLAAGRYLGTRGGARVNLSAAADLLVGARR
ncbi:sugar hydrolase [Actinocatenispora thailandica]|uniref:Sugar hydrolase n=1 Tax=Actinocatenispora thailandica TaxID=227318 RepID=A0A7R7HUM0_9ACTN|nr:glycoside hydrolase family 3 protein [Actinocatenispora thailandica]BCJ32763.1 sugar hydrolase [Actinocatenispora thailandica]